MVVTGNGQQITGPEYWNLDRVDNDFPPYDNLFTWQYDGQGIPIYVLDTGVNGAHEEFIGRMGKGIDLVTPGGDPNVDCNGHGTHVAGTAAGTRSGIAKMATIVPVRVMGCNRGGMTSVLIAGINWVLTQPRGVMLLTLGSAVSGGVNDAVATAVARDYIVVTTAGNNNTDACTQSPASAPDAITVAATNTEDRRSSYSNYGSCVDIFAPGDNIYSAKNTASNTYTYNSGTSMAAALVAGAAAAFLGSNPSLSAVQIATIMGNEATKGIVLDPMGSSNRLLKTSGTPNLNSPSPVTPSPSPDPVSPSPSPVIPSNDLCVNAIELPCNTTVQGTTRLATYNQSPVTCNTTHTAPEVWYYIDVPAGQVNVSMCNTANYDSKLTIWGGSCTSEDMSTLQCMSGADDSAGCYRTTFLAQPMSAGRYLIMVHGYLTRTGDFSLTLTCPPAPISSPSSMHSPRSTPFDSPWPSPSSSQSSSPMPFTNPFSSKPSSHVPCDSSSASLSASPSATSAQPLPGQSPKPSTSPLPNRSPNSSVSPSRSPSPSQSPKPSAIPSHSPSPSRSPKPSANPSHSPSPSRSPKPSTNYFSNAMSSAISRATPSVSQSPSPISPASSSSLLDIAAGFNSVASAGSNLSFSLSPGSMYPVALDLTVEVSQSRASVSMYTAGMDDWGYYIGIKEQITSQSTANVSALAAAINETKVIMYNDGFHAHVLTQQSANFVLSTPNNSAINVQVSDWDPGVAKAVITSFIINSYTLSQIHLTQDGVKPVLFACQVDRMDDSGHLLNNRPLALQIKFSQDIPFTVTLHSADDSEGFDLAAAGGHSTYDTVHNCYSVHVPHTSLIVIRAVLESTQGTIKGTSTSHFPYALLGFLAILPIGVAFSYILYKLSQRARHTVELSEASPSASHSTAFGKAPGLRSLCLNSPLLTPETHHYGIERPNPELLETSPSMSQSPRNRNSPTLHHPITVAPFNSPELRYYDIESPGAEH